MGTKISVLLFSFLLLGLFTGPFLPADETEDPITTYSREEGYSTYGQISLSASKEKIDAVLWNFTDYENWLLDGLTREDPEAKKLTCTLNSMKFIQDRSIFRILFSLNFWFLKNREYSISFTVKPMDNGTDGIRLDVVDEGKITKIIDTLSYTISTDHQGDKATIYYTGQCRLRGLAARFFTLNLYKKNIEWYIRTFAKNFMKKLGSQDLVFFASND